MIFEHGRIREVSTYCCAVSCSMRVWKVSQPDVAVDSETSVSWLYRVSQKELYKCYCVASVKKTFTLKSVQTIHRSTPYECR